MNTSLEVSREGRVLRLTLAREAKRNALSQQLSTDLVDAIEASWNDSSVGAVLIDAKGPVFCAGMDLDELLEPGAAERTAIHERLFTLADRAPKPIVGAVQGPALGGGVGLIANCHIAVAAQGCSFGLTEIRIGLWPFAIFRSVATAIGERRATELSLTGRIFQIPEALQWGFIAESAPAFELDDRATAIATHLAESSSQAMEAGLRFVAASRELNTEKAVALGLRERSNVFDSADFREGVAAFKEKRKPRWTR